MKRKIFQYKSFYVIFSTMSFKTRMDDILLGLLSCGGIFKACTDSTLSDCKVYSFEEFRIGFILFGFAFGIEKEFKELNENHATKNDNLLKAV